MMDKNYEALEDFEIVISRQKKNPQAQFRKGFSLKNIGDIDKATKCLHKAVELSEQSGEFNPMLKVNLIKISNVHQVNIFDAGHEPEFPNSGVKNLLLI